jgi:hypothetical protein
VVIEYPFGQTLEAFVVDVAGAVEPGAWGTCDGDAIGTFDSIGDVDDVPNGVSPATWCRSSSTSPRC